MSPLTKLQIKQMKNADDFFLEYFTRDGEVYSNLRASVREEKSSTGYRQDATIPVKASINISQGYKHMNPLREENYKGKIKCFAYLNAVDFSPHVQAFLAFIKEGDEVEIEWDATEPETNDPHWYGDYMVCGHPGYKGQLLNYDTVSLIVVREVRGVKKHYAFQVYTSICPDNSARMIRKNGGYW